MKIQFLVWIAVLFSLLVSVNAATCDSGSTQQAFVNLTGFSTTVSPAFINVPLNSTLLSFTNFSSSANLRVHFINSTVDVPLNTSAYAYWPEFWNATFGRANLAVRIPELKSSGDALELCFGANLTTQANEANAYQDYSSGYAYTFERNAGAVAGGYSSTGSNNATANSTAFSVVNTLYANKSARLLNTGLVNSYFQTPLSLNLTKGILTWRVTFPTGVTNGTYVAYDTANGFFGLQNYAGSTFGCVGYDTGVKPAVAATSNFAANTTYTLTCTYDSSNLIFYKDGTQLALSGMGVFGGSGLLALGASTAGTSTDVVIDDFFMVKNPASFMTLNWTSAQFNTGVPTSQQYTLSGSSPDTTPPTIANVNAPANGTTFAPSLYESFNASVNDSSGVSAKIFNMDGVNVSVTDPANYSTTKLAAGNHSFYVFANDTLGNAAQSSTFTLSIPQATPVLNFTLNGTTTSMNLSNGKTTVVIANVTNGLSPVVMLSVNSTNVQNGTGSVTNTTQSPFVTVRTFNYSASTYGDANYTPVSSPTYLYVTYNENSPTVSKQNVTGNNTVWVSGMNYSFLYNAYGNGFGIAYKYFKVDSNFYNVSTLDYANNNLNLTLSNLTAGTHVMKYATNDTTGNSASTLSSSQNFSLVLNPAQAAAQLYFNNVGGNFSVPSGLPYTVLANFSAADATNGTLYLNGTQIQFSTLNFTNSSITTGMPQTLNFTLVTPASQNYTTNVVYQYVTVIPSPQITSVSSVQNGSTYSSGLYVAFNESTVNYTSLTTKIFNVDGNNFTANAATDGNFSLTSLNAGTHSWYVFVQDVFGNVNQSLSQSLVINKNIPFLTLTLNGTAGDVSITNRQEIDAAVSGFSGNTLSVNLTSNASVIQTGTVPPGFTNATTYNVGGTYNLTAYTSGNENYTSVEVQRFLNVLVPVPTLTSVNSAQDGSTYAFGLYVAFNESTVNDTDLSTKVFNVDGLNHTVSGDSNFSMTSLSAGMHGWYVFVRDDFGNVNQSGPQTLTINQAPTNMTITMNGTSVDLLLSENSQVEFNASTGAGYALTIGLYRNGTLNVTQVEPFSADVQFGHSDDSMNWTAYTAGDVNYTSSSFARFLTLDSSPPIITNMASAQDFSTWHPGIYVAVNASAFDAHFDIKGFSMDGVNYTVSANDNYSTTTLSAGAHVWTAFANDTLGHLAESTDQIVTLLKATPTIALTLNSSASDFTMLVNQQVNETLTGSATDALSASLLENSSVVQTGLLNTGFSHQSVFVTTSTRNVSAYTPGNVNYSSAIQSFNANVNAPNPSVALSVLNNESTWGQNQDDFAASANGGTADLDSFTVNVDGIIFVLASNIGSTGFSLNAPIPFKYASAGYHTLFGCVNTTYGTSACSTPVVKNFTKVDPCQILSVNASDTDVASNIVHHDYLTVDSGTFVNVSSYLSCASQFLPLSNVTIYLNGVSIANGFVGPNDPIGTTQKVLFDYREYDAPESTNVTFVWQLRYTGDSNTTGLGSDDACNLLGTCVCTDNTCQRLSITVVGPAPFVRKGYIPLYSSGDATNASIDFVATMIVVAADNSSTIGALIVGIILIGLVIVLLNHEEEIFDKVRKVK